MDIKSIACNAGKSPPSLSCGFPAQAGVIFDFSLSSLLWLGLEEELTLFEVIKRVSLVMEAVMSGLYDIDVICCRER